MIRRKIVRQIKKAIKQYPVVSITGPRQSGKTTLVRNVFEKFSYYNLEDPLEREFARTDPKAFLNQATKMIIDEVQRVPDLFSHIQVIVDDDEERKFLITGSQNFLISEKITQSLAGRVAIFQLLPLSLRELRKENLLKKDMFELMVTGCYPKLYDKSIDALQWYHNYIETYLERDVRQIKTIKNMVTFQRFLVLCAGRTGQILNVSSLSNALDVSVGTVNDWLSILEASYVIYRLQPYHTNFNKRIIKSPKIYFYDTGLICALLDINNGEQLKNHPLMGSIFETLVMSEYVKQNVNHLYRYNFYYFRDKTGNEVDVVFDVGTKTKLIEIKSSQTFSSDFVKNFDYYEKISGQKTENTLIYSGESDHRRSNFVLKPYYKIKL